MAAGITPWISALLRLQLDLDFLQVLHRVDVPPVPVVGEGGYLAVRDELRECLPLDVPLLRQVLQESLHVRDVDAPIDPDVRKLGLLLELPHRPELVDIHDPEPRSVRDDEHRDRGLGGRVMPVSHPLQLEVCYHVAVEDDSRTFLFNPRESFLDCSPRPDGLLLDAIIDRETLEALAEVVLQFLPTVPTGEDDSVDCRVLPEPLYLMLRDWPSVDGNQGFGLIVRQRPKAQTLATAQDNCLQGICFGGNVDIKCFTGIEAGLHQVREKCFGGYRS